MNKKDTTNWRQIYLDNTTWFERLVDKIEDSYPVQLYYDLRWWLFDGKAYWDDAVKCDRKLCRYCGNKPWKTNTNTYHK